MQDDIYMPMQKSGIISQLVDGEMLILNNQGAEVHQLNEVASLIWSNCDGSHSVENITQIVFQQYSVSQTQAAKDVAEAISRLNEKGLLK
ncbi:hypothetical protein MNBD_GAMMA11-2923 [hydrothermal vent metagenome]|uniref:Coenzyme PQQ synthesis protein D (PqqD) n=1 Tax=hydrothermal vent metagenome TaxID=652676 RepID=A0A3B0XTT1_9ZZZZ